MMKLAVVQYHSVKGEISSNIQKHIAIVQKVQHKSPDLIVFPELSLTGYEPELAELLAIDEDADILQPLEEASRKFSVIICAGIPVRTSGQIRIGMVILHPHLPKKFYYKQFLHPDEEPYFSPGNSPVTLQYNGHGLSFAICYEVFAEKHWQQAIEAKTDIYVASVAKSKKGMEKALTTLESLSAKNQWTILLSNSIGPSDNFTGAGTSSMWDSEGKLQQQLGHDEEGILLFDTNTGFSEIIRIIDPFNK